MDAEPLKYVNGTAVHVMDDKGGLEVNNKSR